MVNLEEDVEDVCILLVKVIEFIFELFDLWLRLVYLEILENVCKVFNKVVKKFINFYELWIVVVCLEE